MLDGPTTQFHCRPLLFELGPVEHFRTEFIIATMIDPSIPDSQTTATHTEPTIATQSHPPSRNESAQAPPHDRTITQGTAASRTTQNSGLFHFEPHDIRAPIGHAPDTRLMPVPVNTMSTAIRPLLPMDLARHADQASHEVRHNNSIFEENQDEVTMTTDPAFAQLRFIAEKQRGKFAARSLEDEEYVLQSQRPVKVLWIVSLYAKTLTRVIVDFSTISLSRSRIRANNNNRSKY
jgi:hypothetical protein